MGGLLTGVFSKKLKATAGSFILIGCAVSALAGGVALQFLGGATAIYLVLIIGSGLLTALSTAFQIQIMSYIQILTPKELIGKVIACVICVCMCTNPLGSFLYGLVFEKIGSVPYLPFYAAAIIIIGVSLFSRRVFSGIDRLVAGGK